MASDPTSLLQSLIGTTGLSGGIMQQAQQNALQGQQAEQQFALGGQQLQLGQQQIAANDQAVQQQNAYDGDVSAWLAKGGDGAGLSQLVAKYPRQWQALQQSWKIKSDDQSKADLKSYGAVFNALDNGSPDVALQELQNRAAAEKAAGHDTTEIDQHIDQIKAGNPQAMAAVKGWARAQIAAANPEAAQAVGVDLNDTRYKAISGKGVFDTRTGQYVADPTGGGDPASDGAGGGSTAGSRDTSRIINTDAGGGQVPDSVKTVGQFITFGKALNAKGAKSSSAGTYQINGSTMAEFAPKALGADWKNQPYDANAQDKVGEAIFNWAQSQPNPGAALKGRWVSLSADKANQLVKGTWDQAKGTIAAGETGGGAGASANAGGAPGGILRGVGQYSAAAIDSMARAEKLPPGIPKDVRAAVINRKATIDAAQTDNGSTGEAYLSTLAPGRASLLRAINDGRAPAPKPGSRFGEALSEDLARSFPSVDTTQFAAKQKTRNDFTGNGVAARSMASYNRFAAHINSAWDISQRLAGPNLGPLSGVAAGAMQSFSPRDVSAYNTEIDGIQGEFQKLTKNGVANESEAQRLIHAARAAQSTEGRIGALQAMARLVAGAYQPQVSQWQSAFPGKPLPVDVTPQAKASINNIIHNGKTALPTGPNGAPVGNARGFATEGAQSRARFSHMSASGKFGWNGHAWVAAQ